MDLKKFNPQNLLPFLDDLANRVPEKIASIITKVLIAILGVFLITAAYYGWNLGKESAPEEGQSLADDTKSLFYEDIQREYNRKRRDIKMPDLNSVLSGSDKQSMEYESSSRNLPQKSKEILDDDKNNLENERGFKSLKRNLTSPPVIEEKEINTISKSHDNISGTRMGDVKTEETGEDILKTSKSKPEGRLLKKKEMDPTLHEKKSYPSFNEKETIEEKGYLRIKNPDDETPSPDKKTSKRQLLKK